MSNIPHAVFLMGPTAVGKTSLALALHDALPLEIVSVDSSQIYRGMDIGTAKPTLIEQARAPHRLIDIRDPSQTYSAAEFSTDALKEMAAITQANKIPLLVGGAMFYFHALEFGLSDLPSADDEIRTRLLKEAEMIGWPAMHGRLKEIDAVSAARIHPHDTQRIQRAMEIYELTGQPPSVFAMGRPRTALPYRITKIALWPKQRALLHDRIERRFHSMLEQGFISEVKHLRQRGDLEPKMSSLRSVGYRQIWEYLTDTINYSEMIRQATAATRQFAKRQMTWLRSYPGLHRFEIGDLPPVNECVDYLRGNMCL